jgi:Putative DNA-binding domain
MLDQSHLANLKTWTDADLPTILPKAENAEFEFKSSLTGDGKLQTIIQKAASGFWNSGGGYFIAGVDDKTGQPDGGISTTVGRTPRRDWIDRAISAVAPPYPNGYEIQEITAGSAGLRIDSGKAVYVVGFAASEFAPHMGDGSYYIRAGAHTDPAPHFLVEALFARRGKRQPQLRVQVRPNPVQTWVLQLGVVNVGHVPAIDVELTFEKSPAGMKADQATGRATARVNLIDREAPLYLNYAQGKTSSKEKPDPLLSENNTVTLRYRDPLLNLYEEVIPINPTQEVAVSSSDGTGLDRIVQSLRTISSTLQELKHKVGR